MKILLVDDDKAVRIALTMALKSMDTNVLCASNGQEALEILALEKFDLILSDINMPVMDGFKFGRILRECLATAELPLVFITGSQPGEIQKEMNELGVEVLLRKPVALGDLKALVERFRKS